MKISPLYISWNIVTKNFKSSVSDIWVMKWIRLLELLLAISV